MKGERVKGEEVKRGKGGKVDFLKGKIKIRGGERFWGIPSLVWSVKQSNMKNFSGISRRPFLLLSLLFFAISFNVRAQTITGVWRGKIKGQQAEVKIVKSGDELVGAAYYYQKKNKYKRYSLRGHFDPNTNSVIWWDEMLLDDYGTGGIMQLRPDAGAQMMVADFNCPGGEEMYLDGTSSSRDGRPAPDRHRAQIEHGAVRRRGHASSAPACRPEARAGPDG